MTASEPWPGHCRPPRVAVRGWHVFQADPLTGNNTLVYDFDPAGRERLCDVQQQAVSMLAGLRDRSATRARYDKTYLALSDVERRSLDDWGFPFVGEVWHPHVTVASIHPSAWPAVWESVVGCSPSGVLHFSALTLFALEEERPVAVEHLALRSL